MGQTGRYKTDNRMEVGTESRWNQDTRKTGRKRRDRSRFDESNVLILIRTDKRVSQVW